MGRPIHEPKFRDDRALFIIWCRPPEGGLYTIAAGPLVPLMAAWEVVKAEHPAQGDLTLQQGARVLYRRHAAPRVPLP